VLNTLKGGKSDPDVVKLFGRRAKQYGSMTAAREGNPDAHWLDCRFSQRVVERDARRRGPCGLAHRQRPGFAAITECMGGLRHVTVSMTVRRRL